MAKFASFVMFSFYLHHRFYKSVAKELVAQGDSTCISEFKEKLDSRLSQEELYKLYDVVNEQQKTIEELKLRVIYLETQNEPSLKIDRNNYVRESTQTNNEAIN